MRYPVRDLKELLAECYALKNAPGTWHEERAYLDGGARVRKEHETFWTNTIALLEAGRFTEAASELRRRSHEDLARVAERSAK